MWHTKRVVQMETKHKMIWFGYREDKTGFLKSNILYPREFQNSKWSSMKILANATNKTKTNSSKKC